MAGSGLPGTYCHLRHRRQGNHTRPHIRQRQRHPAQPRGPAAGHQLHHPARHAQLLLHPPHQRRGRAVPCRQGRLSAHQRRQLVEALRRTHHDARLAAAARSAGRPHRARLCRIPHPRLGDSSQGGVRPELVHHHLAEVSQRACPGAGPPLWHRRHRLQRRRRHPGLSVAQGAVPRATGPRQTLPRPPHWQATQVPRRESQHLSSLMKAQFFKT